MRWSLKTPGPVERLDFAPGGAELRALVDAGQPKQRGTLQARQYRVQTWRASDGAPLRTIELGLRMPLNLVSVLCQLSADGRSITIDGKVWSTAEGTLPESAAISWQKEACASRSAAPWRAQVQGDTLQLWQGEKLLFRLEGDAKIEDFALSPDRSLVVTADSRGHLRVWRLSSAALVSQACARELRRLTDDEAVLWLGTRKAADPCGRDMGRP